ncbi:ankyrin repeat-containing domain, PGG domain protein [Tanacetum coccineum]
MVGNWDNVEELLSDYMFRVTDRITNNGNTILHIAVNSSKNHELLELLLEQLPVVRDRDLLITKDNKDQTPLAIALSNMHTEISWCLLNHVNTRRQKNNLFAGANSDKLLALAISSKEFGLAHEL